MSKYKNKIQINYCTICKVKVIGYYFCPQCGCETTTLEFSKNKANNMKTAIWIDHKDRK